jgi:MFS family permease
VTAQDNPPIPAAPASTAGIPRQHGAPGPLHTTPERMLPAALAEPTSHVHRSWVALLFSANLGVWMSFFTPIQVLLPNQITAIDPAHHVGLFGLVTGVGAAAAVIANPIAGALSDRTSPLMRGRAYGRRHAWTAGGAILGGLSLALLGRQHTIIGVTVFWVLAQVCLNTMLASLTAAVPDRVPITQRAWVSGWIGIPQGLGLVVGAVLVTMVFTKTASGYASMAVLMMLMALPFALRTPDDPLPREHRPPGEVGPMLRAMWISPRRYPDFAWAWGTRFLVQLGNAMGTLFLLYFLQDKVKVADPDGGVLILILVYTAGLMATAVVSGRISDRTGRRKAPVIVSGGIMAVAALLLAMWPLWPVAVVAAALLGAGYGVYLAVDAALITQVLPHATDRAKDLGVINIANSAPQVLGPALSAPIVVYLGGYATLYAATAAVTVLGSVLVLRIKSVP